METGGAILIYRGQRKRVDPGYKRERPTRLSVLSAPHPPVAEIVPTQRGHTFLLSVLRFVTVHTPKIMLYQFSEYSFVQSG